MSGYNYNCHCSQCGAEMTSRDFDRHECLAISGVKVGDFASFEDYSKACDIAGEKYRKNKGEFMETIKNWQDL